MEKTYEVCPYCGEEVELDAELKVQTCPNCGKRIVTCSMCRACDTGGPYCVRCCLDYQAKAENIDKEDISELTIKFGERRGFGATGHALDEITEWLNEKIPFKQVRINIPYHDFNVRGKAANVHRDVYGVMPSTYLYGDRSKMVDENDTTTLFYGNTKVGRGNYIPFLSDCYVYFIDDCEMSDGELVVNLKKGPNWRMYL
jgi:predicted RNA-binding Zn-ribbon protein involved in translation (DUF1610 family)